MTAKKFLDYHFPKPDDLVNGDFIELFAKKMQEYADIKVRDFKNKVLMELSTINRFEQIKKRIDKL